MEGARPAEPQDATRCAELCRQALDALQRQRGGPLFTRGESGTVVETLLGAGGLDRLLADGRRRVVVGTIDGEVVGLAVGRIEDVGETVIGALDACYVEPDARGVGVGRALVDDLVSWFAASGCRGVDATALPGDRTTKNFYEAAGFKARLITMHRALG